DINFDPQVRPQQPRRYPPSRVISSTKQSTAITKIIKSYRKDTPSSHR
ncbi:36051_t:CDS:1, partial [Racocetra persica]